MGKKKKRKKSKIKSSIAIEKTIETSFTSFDTKTREQPFNFELFPFPLISLRDDYDVYVIKVGNISIGYFGLFNKSGVFNYVILENNIDINETHLLMFLKDFIKKSKLIPQTNSHLQSYC